MARSLELGAEEEYLSHLNGVFIVQVPSNFLKLTVNCQKGQNSLPD